MLSMISQQMLLMVTRNMFPLKPAQKHLGEEALRAQSAS